VKALKWVTTALAAAALIGVLGGGMPVRPAAAAYYENGFFLACYYGGCSGSLSSPSNLNINSVTCLLKSSRPAYSFDQAPGNLAISGSSTPYGGYFWPTFKINPDEAGGLTLIFDGKASAAGNTISANMTSTTVVPTQPDLPHVYAFCRISGTSS